MRHLRKCISICATDSPNVAAGLALEAQGNTPEEVDRLAFVLPGVLSWQDYKKMTRGPTKLDEMDAAVRIHARWYKGAALMLFPQDWLDKAEEVATELPERRRAEAIGVDSGEGGDESAWAVIDEEGLIHLEALKTPDTSVITSKTLAMMKEWGVPQNESWRVCFDRGGGGKEHADRLREMGFQVRTVAFGEAVVPDVKRPMEVVGMRKRVEQRETKYTYVNRRAEMFGELSMLLDPSTVVGPFKKGFGLPRRYGELRRQLSVIPKGYDREGRLRLAPKNRVSQDSKEVTLRDLMGCSPDHADALAVAVWSMQNPPQRMRASAG